MRFIKYFIFILLSITTALLVYFFIYATLEKKWEASAYIGNSFILMLFLVCLYSLGKNINKTRVKKQRDNITLETCNATNTDLEELREVDEPIDIPHEEVLEISDIINSNSFDKISRESIEDRAKILNCDVGSFLENIIYDAIYEITAESPILSKEQEESIRKLFAICGVEITPELGNQLNKHATIRNIVSFKHNPRAFISKSLSFTGG